MNEIKAAVDAAASHPAIASAVAATTVTGGVISVVSQVQTILGLISVAIGCVIGVLVVRVQWHKGNLLKRDWEKGTHRAQLD